MPPPSLDYRNEYNKNYILYWNNVGLDLNQRVHSLAAQDLSAPLTGPPVSARALGMLHLAIHDAYFATRPASERGNFNLYLGANLPTTPPSIVTMIPNKDLSRQTVAGAAITALERMYATANPGISTKATQNLASLITNYKNGFKGLDPGSPGYRYGAQIGNKVVDLLALKGDEIKQDGYHPGNGPYLFDDEPTHPIRIVPQDINDPTGPQKVAHVYHAPFYGATAKRFAIQSDHIIADPPVTGYKYKEGTTPTPTIVRTPEYDDAVKDVHRMGGVPELSSTKRRPYQTAGAYFWAYDGANLIGTPPRLYNQILRQIAWGKRKNSSDPEHEANNKDFARLFALANVAMTDAGILCWREKYYFELWRPLSGLRSDPEPELADPFWLTLGAPDTNTNHFHFKPPFPAYPSGHAAFAAACFQIARLHYGIEGDTPDNISFEFVSDELNGVNRELAQPYDKDKPITDQPGTVRTFAPRKFKSLWHAIFDNAMSRIWLGVHWRFDAFAAKDVLIENTAPPPPPSGTDTSIYQLDEYGATKYKDPQTIKYLTTGTRKDGPAGNHMIGGVPLGIAIANDIYSTKMKQASQNVQPVPAMGM
jgi:vanadium chloroperoxidase